MADRSGLRLNDLKQRRPSATRLMNVKVPTALANRLDQLARQFSVSKTEVVLALLNEGLAQAKVLKVI